MRVELQRILFNDEITFGSLIVGSHQIFTLEDTYREEKLKGETRIPAGEYELALRTEGGMHPKYQKRYGSMHKGMIHLLNVPNYNWIYIHTGNQKDHTDGCILTGTKAWGRHQISGSRTAYKLIYPVIADAILHEGCSIRIKDEPFADRPT